MFAGQGIGLALPTSVVGRFRWGETMDLTGHRSTASVVGYFRKHPVDSKASRLLDAFEPTE